VPQATTIRWLRLSKPPLLFRDGVVEVFEYVAYIIVAFECLVVAFENLRQQQGG
jgi:hypothetical protein